MVRLLFIVWMKFSYLFPRFNSNMVRLQRLFLSRSRDSMLMFQFQYGTIITITQVEYPLKNIFFQFQYGTIITIQFVKTSSNTNICFNSNMVRLKRECLDGGYSPCRKFQFHCGAILTPSMQSKHGMSSSFQFQFGTIKTLRNGLNSPNRTCFNSNMVRLNLIYNIAFLDLLLVSIPMWCD